MASSTTTVDVHLNGETHSIALDGGASVEGLKRRLSTLSGIPTGTLQLVCAGEVLQDDEQRVCDLQRTSLIAWTARYSKVRSDDAHAAAEATRRKDQERRAELARPLWRRLLASARQHAPTVVAALRTVGPRTWLKLAVWFALMLVCRHYRLGQPFVITTLIVLMLSNLGERKPGEASAYTVFNDGMEALPGQLMMEDFEGELRGA